MVVPILMLLLAPPGEEWPREAVTQPNALFLGWQSDTAWVSETVVHDLSAEVEEALLLITAAGSATASIPPPEHTEPGTPVASMASILDGTAAYSLKLDYSEEDLHRMAEACLNFQDHLDGEPPVVPVRMALVSLVDSTEVWSARRSLTWFGGECAPIFHLPLLDRAVLSPDSSLVWFSILYGPYMEYFVAPVAPREKELPGCPPSVPRGSRKSHPGRITSCTGTVYLHLERYRRGGMVHT